MNSGKLGTPLSRVAQGKAKLFEEDRGSLGVIEIANYAPFAPVRIFWISDVAPGKTRGGHAHKACSQFFVCIRGKIQVDAFDGTLSQNFVLGRGDFLNLVPGIFATETFMDEGSILLVLCDRLYEQDDYIYDRDALVPDVRE
jgi:hypothetical protein